jgi:peptidoglycan/LPS O-acetylase OafA/YrhL
MAALSSREQPNLDLVRATAVLCVFAGHLYNDTFNVDALTAWRFAQMGVIMFFVHTAYVLMWSLERSAALPPREMMTDFYIRRAFRIYPLSILFVLLAWFGVIIAPRVFSVAELLANLTLTMNLTRSHVMWGVQWTLPIEVQMYMVLPVLFVLLRPRHFAFAGAAWILAVVAAILRPSARLDVMEYAPCFMSGVVAWHLARQYQPRINAWLWPVVFVAIWPIWLVTEQAGREPYRWAFCLALGCAIPWFKPLTWRPLTAASAWIAKYSYGIYLSHAAVFAFALGFQQPLVRWPLLIVLVIVVPVILFHGLEQPMIGAGKRIAELTRKRRRRSEQAVLAT